ncbi:MAG TPA: tetratricopeptide repeat protein, partial [Thermoanaerobaculia bacterium]|nr:tetratricopeptide repeat protein [Thermoanaerobaculia bacterium]
MPLLFLLLIGGAAAAPSAETSYRQAKAAFDGGDYNATLAIAGAALPRYGDSDDPWVWRLRIVYADALIGSSKFDDARALLERPLPPKLRATDVEVLRLRGLAIVAYRNGDRKLADRLIREAYPLAQKIPQTLPTVLVVMMTLDVERAAKWGAEALEAARKYGDTQTELRVLGTLGRALANEDRFDEALAMWEPLVAKARAVGNLSFLEKFEGNVGWAYLELGDYEAAGQHFRDAYDGAKRIGAKFDLVPWTYQLGNVALQQNDVDAAQKRYLEAYQVASKDKH